MFVHVNTIIFYQRLKMLLFIVNKIKGSALVKEKKKALDVTKFIIDLVNNEAL